MRLSIRILGPAAVSLVVSACGGSALPTTPDPALAVDVHVLERLPADTLFVGRVDLEALRRTTAFEAVAAMPGVSAEAVARFGSLDRIYLSLGPMVAAPEMFEPDAVAAIEPPEDEGDEEEVEEDVDESAPLSTLTTSMFGDPASETTTWWLRAFGRRFPNFMLLIEPDASGDACAKLFEGTSPREEEGLTLVVNHGIAVFRTSDGLCGVTLPSSVDALRARRGLHSRAVLRLLEAGAAEHDLGIFATATEGSGQLVRAWIAEASTDVSPTEQRIFAWATRVSTAWNRGVLGSSTVVRFEDQHFEVDTRTRYEDERRASAHELVAETAREITDATLELIAAVSEGAIPSGAGESLRIEREDSEIRVRWTLAETYVSSMLEGMLAPARMAAETMLGDSMGVDVDTSVEDYALASLPAPTRIERLDGIRAELETNPDRITAARALASAYAIRGRFDDARALRAAVRRLVETATPDAAAAEDLEIARVDIEAFELTEAARVLDATVANSTSDPLIQLEKARIARLRGHLDAADAILLELRALSYNPIETSLAIVVEQCRVLDARGRTVEALGILEAALSLGVGASGEVAVDAHAAHVELLIRLGRSADALDGPLERMRQAIASIAPDSEVGTARADRLACRAQRILQSNDDALALCETAVRSAVLAHDEAHPAVAAARLELAAMLFVRDRGSEGAAEVDRAEAALVHCSDAHPLRAEITRLRSPAQRRRLRR